jgi:hypothetical protein
MRRTRTACGSTPTYTRPAPPPNARYLFRSARTAAAWALAGLLLGAATWAALLAAALWWTR